MLPAFQNTMAYYEYVEGDAEIMGVLPLYGRFRKIFSIAFDGETIGAVTRNRIP